MSYNDPFYGDAIMNKIKKQHENNTEQKLNTRHFFRLARVKQTIDWHELLLICWIQFIQSHSNYENKN